jgi:hypothetical protein
MNRRLRLVAPCGALTLLPGIAPAQVPCAGTTPWLITAEEFAQAASEESDCWEKLTVEKRIFDE